MGLAISDETATVASPSGSVPAEPLTTLAGRLAAVAAGAGASRIVVGLPRLMDGGEAGSATAARALAAELRTASQLPVTMVDERLTSVAAERHLVAAGMSRKRRRAEVDGVAAALILQTFLERNRSGL